MTLRALRRVAAGLGVLLLSLPAIPPAAAAPSTEPISADDCKRAPGAGSPTSTWALDRLQLAKTNPITRGKRVDTGVPVPVAVIDSGIDPVHPQLKGVDFARLRNALRNDPGVKIKDCAGHGTQVTAILAAQPDAKHPDFVGVAPDVQVIPIKVTNRTDVVAAADVARAINLAVDAKAKIVNMSLVLRADVPAVRTAVARAQRAGILIVAAAGNDGNTPNQLPQYPAAYATTFDNVLGVGAETADGTVAMFSGTGRYVDLVAPGAAVQTIGVAGGYLVQEGTSFAAPYVSGVAALVLAANPKMTAKTLRSRLLATADAPPATTPDVRWGYGTVDPYLAVTSLRNDSLTATPTTERPQPIAAGRTPAAPDRSLQHTSLAVALGLLGLMAAVMVAAAVLRGRSRSRLPAH